MWDKLFGNGLAFCWMFYGIGLFAIALAVGTATGYLPLNVPPHEKADFLVGVIGAGLAAMSPGILGHLHYLWTQRRVDRAERA